MEKSDFLSNYKLEGERLEIFTYPAPVLKKKAEPVTQFDDDLRSLIKNMLFTMYKAPGIGLAAPQIGVSKKIIVMDIDFEKEEVTKPDGSTEKRLVNFNPRIFINPVLKNQKGEILYEEGCLSVPGIYEKVKRAEKVTVEFQNMYGENEVIEAEELLSVCIQHENDHLEGIVFIEKLSLLKQNLLKKKYMKSKKRVHA